MNPVSERLKEQRDHGTSVFPCGLYEVFEDTVWSGAKHHWHDEMEIIYFMKGVLKILFTQFVRWGLTRVVARRFSWIRMVILLTRGLLQIKCTWG